MENKITDVKDWIGKVLWWVDPDCTLMSGEVTTVTAIHKAYGMVQFLLTGNECTHDSEGIPLLNRSGVTFVDQYKSLRNKFFSKAEAIRYFLNEQEERVYSDGKYYQEHMRDFFDERAEETRRALGKLLTDFSDESRLGQNNEDFLKRLDDLRSIASNNYPQQFIAESNFALMASLKNLRALLQKEEANENERSVLDN